jgi:hypothetical protein
LVYVRMFLFKLLTRWTQRALQRRPPVTASSFYGVLVPLSSGIRFCYKFNEEKALEVMIPTLERNSSFETKDLNWWNKPCSNHFNSCVG